MSSAGLLFKAALLLLAQEYLVAYLLHELLENFWAAHAFCPFGAMPARLVLHAPSALQKGPCYTHTYYEGPLMLVHSAMARLKLVDGVQNWPFRIIIPKAFFCSAALHEYLSLSLERMKIFWHSENNVMHFL